MPILKGVRRCPKVKNTPMSVKTKALFIKTKTLFDKSAALFCVFQTFCIVMSIIRLKVLASFEIFVWKI